MRSAGRCAALFLRPVFALIATSNRRAFSAKRAT